MMGIVCGKDILGRTYTYRVPDIKNDMLNPPAPPKEVELGRRYLIRLNEDGSGTLVERDGDATYPLEMMSAARIETFAYELDRELGATR